MVQSDCTNCNSRPAVHHPTRRRMPASAFHFRGSFELLPDPPSGYLKKITAEGTEEEEPKDILHSNISCCVYRHSPYFYNYRNNIQVLIRIFGHRKRDRCRPTPIGLRRNA